MLGKANRTGLKKTFKLNQQLTPLLALLFKRNMRVRLTSAVGNVDESKINYLGATTETHNKSMVPGKAPPAGVTLSGFSYATLRCSGA